MRTIAPRISVKHLRWVVTVLLVFAFAALVLTVVLGFEEPNELLVLLLSGLMSAAVLAVFAHLALTGELNRSEKRLWLSRLTGRHAPWALSDYLTCDDLQARARNFVEDDR